MVGLLSSKSQDYQQIKTHAFNTQWDILLQLDFSKEILKHISVECWFSGSVLCRKHNDTILTFKNTLRTEMKDNFQIAFHILYNRQLKFYVDLVKSLQECWGMLVLLVGYMYLNENS